MPFEGTEPHATVVFPELFAAELDVVLVLFLGMKKKFIPLWLTNFSRILISLRLIQIYMKNLN